MNKEIGLKITSAILLGTMGLGGCGSAPKEEKSATDHYENLEKEGARQYILATSITDQLSRYHIVSREQKRLSSGLTVNFMETTGGPFSVNPENLPLIMDQLFKFNDKILAAEVLRDDKRLEQVLKNIKVAQTLYQSGQMRGVVIDVVLPPVGDSCLNNKAIFDKPTKPRSQGFTGTSCTDGFGYTFYAVEKGVVPRHFLIGVSSGTYQDKVDVVYGDHYVLNSQQSTFGVLAHELVHFVSAFGRNPNQTPDSGAEEIIAQNFQEYLIIAQGIKPVGN